MLAASPVLSSTSTCRRNCHLYRQGRQCAGRDVIGAFMDVMGAFMDVIGADTAVNGAVAGAAVPSSVSSPSQPLLPPQQ